MTKVWGKHEIRFGVQINKIDFTHARADKVVGSITSLVALIDGDQLNLSIPSVNQPAVCSGSITGNCIPSNQLTNWDRYYASLLGLVDNVGILAVRNQNLQPQPFGTFLRDVTNQYATLFLCAGFLPHQAVFDPVLRPVLWLSDRADRTEQPANHHDQRRDRRA